MYECKTCGEKFENHFKLGHHCAMVHSNLLQSNEKRKESLKNKYELNPIICKNCNSVIPYSKRLDRNKKFCSRSCAASFNNKGRKIERPKKEKILKEKREIWEELKNDWLSNLEINEFSLPHGEIRSQIKRKIKEFLLEEQNHKCLICGQIDVWNNKPLTLTLDHIDGNYTNQKRNNLRLICQHCDSQLPTHGSKNRGKGRKARREWQQKTTNALLVNQL